MCFIIKAYAMIWGLPLIKLTQNEQKFAGKKSNLVARHRRLIVVTVVYLLATDNKAVAPTTKQKAPGAASSRSRKLPRDEVSVSNVPPDASQKKRRRFECTVCSRKFVSEWHRRAHWKSHDKCNLSLNRDVSNDTMMEDANTSTEPIVQTSAGEREVYWSLPLPRPWRLLCYYYFFWYFFSLSFIFRPKFVSNLSCRTCRPRGMTFGR